MTSPEQVSSDPVQPTRETLAKPLDLSALLRDAFLAGRGLKDGDKLSDDDQAAWMAYDPELMLAYKRITASLDLARRAACSAPEAGKAVGRDFYLMYDHQIGKWCVQNEPFKVIRTGADVIHTKEIASPGQEWEREVADLVRSIAEWDDRTSPEDYPDHLLLTPQELTEFARCVAALASVPAPSGAEAVVWVRREDITRDFWAIPAWRTKGEGHGEGANVPLYATPQAVPAEDVASLVERLKSSGDHYGIPVERDFAEAARAITSLAINLDLWKQNCHKAVDLANSNAARAEASEAEATSLRRKLEEAEQKAERQWEGWVREEAARKSTERKLEEARKALEPFEHYVDEWTDRFDDDTPIIDEDGEFVAKLGAFRAARSALATVEGRET